MKRAFRNLFVLILLAACATLVCAAALALHSTAVDPVNAQEESAEPDPFADLPEEGLFEGKVPESTRKVIVLQAANVGSINDNPLDDLKTADRYIAEGLTLMVEQHLQYLPQLTTDNQVKRIQRFAVRLRDASVPHAGDTEFTGVKNTCLDEGVKTFNADLLFILSFVPTDDGAKGLVYRYSKEQGVHEPAEWEFGKLGSPEPDSVSRQLEAITSGLFKGLAAEGEHAPVPKLVSSDKALRAFARMTLAFKSSNITEAWIEYETLVGADKKAGRAAHYAMEVFLALSAEQSNAGENRKYLMKAVEAGREALKHVPNDTHIRGRLGWIAASHMGKFGFGKKAIEQALRVQPANTNEIERYLTVYKIDSGEGQIEWLKDYALPKVKSGRIEQTIATILFNMGDYAGGVEWYKKAQEIAPDEFEIQVSTGLCGFYKALKLAKADKEEEAVEAYADASDALRAALRIDPQEVPYIYDYYVRSATCEFTQLPSNTDDRLELFLVQSVLTGLQSTSRTFQWDRLVKEVLPLQKRLVKSAVKDADESDELYVLKLLARLRLAAADKDNDEVVHTLWLMKEAGYRPDPYITYMTSFGGVVHDYKPDTPEEEPSDG